MGNFATRASLLQKSLDSGLFFRDRSLKRQARPMMDAVAISSSSRASDTLPDTL
jgi:hypothetical protein